MTDTETFNECPWCGSEVSESEIRITCTKRYCDWWFLKQPEDTSKLRVIAIYVLGHDPFPVAFFRYPEHAVEWSRSNFFGNWLIKVVEVPAETLFSHVTEEQWKEAETKAEELASIFQNASEEDTTLIGPSPCPYCGGEYGQHINECPKGKDDD
jgi:hypothetical protein